MAFENPVCPLCSEKDAEIIIEGEDYFLGCAGKFKVVRCTACEHQYTTPRPVPKDIDQYYPQNYEIFGDKKGLSYKLQMVLEKYRSKAYMRGLPRQASVLELGCGTAELLALLAERGYKVKGIEPSSHAVEAAYKRHGLVIEKNTAEGMDLPNEEYDLIVMRQVIEHLYDPVGVVEKLQKALKKGGRIIISCPNNKGIENTIFGKYSFSYDLPRHLHHFSPKTLARLLADKGFERISVSYSAVSNDWVRSFSFVSKKTMPKGVSRFFSIANTPLLLLLLPLSTLASILRRSGRMTLTATKNTGN